MGLLLAGLLAGVAVFSVVAYAGALPGLTPSLTLQVGFQDLSLKIDGISGELDSLSQTIQSKMSSLSTMILDTQSIIGDVPTQLSTVSSDVDDLTTDVAEVLARIGEPSSTLFGMLADLQSMLTQHTAETSSQLESMNSVLTSISDQISSLDIEVISLQLQSIESTIADLQTEVDAIEAKLDPGGAFSVFVENWFTTIQTAIANAQNAIVAEIDANEAKLVDTVIPMLGQGLPGETEGLRVECPSGLGVSPCDGVSGINSLGVFSLPHPKKVSLWVWGALDAGDVFRLRAEVYWPVEGLTSCAGDVYFSAIFDEVTIDSTNSFSLVLAYDQLPVPCGILFTVERTGSAGGDTDSLFFAVVMEEV